MLISQNINFRVDTGIILHVYVVMELFLGLHAILNTVKPLLGEVTSLEGPYIPGSKFLHFDEFDPVTKGHLS